jgi:hypothetical protein
MNVPTQKRGSWLIEVEGKRRKFRTEEEAWEAIGGRPVDEVQEEFEWTRSQEKYSEKDQVGLFDIEDDSLNS